MGDDHCEEAERLWRAFRRDLSASILELAGFRDGNALSRLQNTWERICDADLNIAAALYHGVSEVSGMMGRYGEPNSPADHHLRQLQELTGLVTIAREANPSIRVETVGELLSLGEEEIRRQVDDDTSETPMTRDATSGGNRRRNARAMRALGNQWSRVSAGRCAYVRCNTFDRPFAR
jgi:hypothetical protein